jgi:hypothetical protein
LDVARLRHDARQKILQLHRLVRHDPEVVPLVLRPDVTPFAGSYRVIADAQKAVPNLPRIPSTSAIAELAQLMQELDVSEARVRASDRFRSRGAVFLELAAKRAGVRLNHLH